MHRALWSSSYLAAVPATPVHRAASRAGLTALKDGACAQPLGHHGAL